MTDKEYLGDGVYMCVDRGSILLTTEDGVRTTNSIYLETEMIGQLSNYLKRIMNRYQSKDNIQSDGDEI